MSVLGFMSAAGRCNQTRGLPLSSHGLVLLFFAVAECWWTMRACACGFSVSRRPLVSVHAPAVCRRLVRRCRHAVVGSGRGGEARQTHTLIGAHCVDAFCISAQGHPIV